MLRPEFILSFSQLTLTQLVGKTQVKHNLFLSLCKDGKQYWRHPATLNLNYFSLFLNPVFAFLRSKKKRHRDKGWKDKETRLFAGEDNRKVNISPQLTLAVFQYLSTSIEPFKAAFIGDSVLKKLLNLEIFRDIKFKKDKSRMTDDDVTIIHKGKPIDYFVLIVEGRVEVNIGREELVFESGPFTYFGIQGKNLPNPYLYVAFALESLD